MREYQQIGVDWLVNLHKKHLNGILADETGLGKTVQTVAYMAHLAGQEGTLLFRDTQEFFSCGLVLFLRLNFAVVSHRHLGTPPYRSQDMQVAELGGRVQALVSWPKDPPVPWQQKGAQIYKKGVFLSLYASLLRYSFFLQEMAANE